MLKIPAYAWTGAGPHCCHSGSSVDLRSFVVDKFPDNGTLVFENVAVGTWYEMCFVICFAVFLIIAFCWFLKIGIVRKGAIWIISNWLRPGFDESSIISPLINMNNNNNNNNNNPDIKSEDSEKLIKKTPHCQSLVAKSIQKWILPYNVHCTEYFMETSQTFQS